MAVTIQLRRGTSTEWTTENPILAEGELGLETNTRAYKIGDGVTAWNSLDYQELTGVMPSVLLDSVGTSDPSAPASGKLLVYARDICGRIMPKWVGPSGLDTPIQPAIFSNGMIFMAPAVTTSFSVFGTGAPTVVGTASTPAISAGNLIEQSRRTHVVSTATANAAAEIRIPQNICYRGDAAGLGGFHYCQRFAVMSTVATQRSIHGLTSSTGAIATTQSPSALTNCIILANESGDSNLSIMHNDGTGACTVIPLGANFPAKTLNAYYELMLFAPPNAAYVDYRVRRFDSSFEVNGRITTDLPTASQMLTYHGYMNNGGTAAVVTLAQTRFYLETDF